MHMQGGDLDGIPRQAMINLRLHVAAQRLIREPGGAVDQDYEQGEPTQQPDPTAANRERHSTSLLRPTTWPWPSSTRTPPSAPPPMHASQCLRPPRTRGVGSTPRGRCAGRRYLKGS